MFVGIKTFLKNEKCKIYSAPFDVRFPGKETDEQAITVVQPDICVICDESKLDDKGCNGAPDLIIEILSQSTSEKDLKEKFELYEENFVKEYWVVFPEVNVIEVFAIGDNLKYYLSGKYTRSDTITTKILPGLKIELKDILEGR